LVNEGARDCCREKDKKGACPEAPLEQKSDTEGFEGKSPTKRTWKSGNGMLKGNFRRVERMF